MTEQENMQVVGIGFHLEDFTVGRKFQTIGRTITDADLTSFVNSTGMLELIFTNLEHLKHDDVYGGQRPIPASLVFCFSEALLIQGSLLGTGMAFLSMEFNVAKPTFVGDTIHVECEVLEARRTSKGDRGVVKTRNRVVTQTGRQVIQYTVTRMIRARTPSNATG